MIRYYYARRVLVLLLYYSTTTALLRYPLHLLLTNHQLASPLVSHLPRYDRDIDVGDPKKLVLRTAARKRELDNPSFLLSAAHLGIKSRTTIDVFVRSFD